MAAPTRPDWVMSPDWVWSTTSNVSVAKDRGWFTSYTPFTSHLSSFAGGNLAVTGIGSVSIPVKLCSRKKGKTHNALVIDDVLHAPSAACNILGRGDFMDRYRIEAMSDIVDRGGSKVACFDQKKDLFCLQLSGPPVGPVTAPSLFSKSRQGHAAFCINAMWPDAERARWEAPQPYTDAEKAWLKQHFQGEFDFLRQYGLSIYEDEDREEGKRLLRSFMADESLDGSE